MGNINDFQVPGGGPPIEGNEPVSAPPPSTSTPSTSGVDANDVSTISKSTKSAKSSAADASIPNLMMPFMLNYTAAPSSAAVSVAGVATTQAKIMQSMLEGWLANLEELKERDVEERNSAQFLKKMQRESPSSVDNIQVQKIREQTAEMIADIRAAGAYATDRLPPLQDRESFTVAYTNGLTNYIEGLRNNEPNSLSLLPTMVNVVIGVTVAAQAIDLTAISRVTSPSEQVFEELYVQLINTTRNDNAAAMLGYIGGIFATPLVFHAFADVALQPVGGAAKDLETAKAYGKAVIELVRSVGFDQFLSDALNDKLGNSIVGQERKDQLIAQVKLTLIANAMALIYKMETGGITGKEFLAMTDGTMKLPKRDIRLELAKDFNKALEKFSASERANIRSALVAYMDGNPSVESMFKANRMPILTDVSSKLPV